MTFSIRIFLVLSFIAFIHPASYSQNMYVARNGTVSFTSDAPLELIKAGSKELQGAVDIEKQTYIFVLNNASFSGFNSPLQQEHFHENYMESGKYPRTTFTGKIIETLQPEAGKDQYVRAKGILDLHGVKQERIIKAHIHYEANSMTVDAVFPVLLDDHHLRIPKVVSKKIAPEIEVKVNIKLLKEANP